MNMQGKCELQHQIMYRWTNVPSEDSEGCIHLHSLIRIFLGAIWIQSVFMRTMKTDQTVDAQADLSLLGAYARRYVFSPCGS